MPFQTKIKQEDLDQLNAKVKNRGYVDREHMLEFLSLIPDNNSDWIVKEVEEWLTALHNDPNYDKVRFPPGNIQAVLSDLESYGRVKAETILAIKQQSAETVS